MKHGKLKDLLSFTVDNRGKTPPREQFDSENYELLEVNSISANNRHPIYSNVKKYVNKESYDNWFRKGHPKKGDILVPTVGSIGNVSQSEGRGCIAQNLIALRTDSNKLNTDFLYYYLSSERAKNELISLDISSVQPSIKVPHLMELEIPLPTLPEQKRIAHILGSLDDKIELNRKMNATLEAMAQALFKSWFVDFDPVIDNALRAGNPIPPALQAKAELRRLNADFNNGSFTTHHSSFPSAFTHSEDLGWIPEGWEVLTFSDIADTKQGKYLAKKEMSDLPSELNLHPVWGGNGIRGYTQASMYSSPKTLLTCRGSNCGLIKLTRSASWVSNNSFACSANYGSDYFLYLYFKNEDFAACISGSAQPQITYTALKNKIMKHPVDKIICHLFSEMADSFMQKEFFSERQSNELTKLRDTLLPRLISGELRLPDDEHLTKEALA